MTSAYPRGRFRAIILAGACVLATISALRIELLNRAAGDLLPRHERNEQGSLVEWRQSPWTDADAWRMLRGPRDETGQLASRPLTPTENTQMLHDVQEAMAANRLRDVVGTWGLLQYAFVPLLLVTGISLCIESKMRRNYRIVGAGGVLIAVLAGGLMLYRAYFAALGW